MVWDHRIESFDSCFEMEKSFEERVAVGKGEVGE